MQVYCFVALSSTNSLSGGLTEFSQYLEQNQGLKSSLYLTDVQAGTDPVHRVQRGVHDDQLLCVECWNQVDWRVVTSRCSWDSFLYVLLIMCGD